jgi:energy-coupling factor transporter ATP-binding protein EcfA2
MSTLPRPQPRPPPRLTPGSNRVCAPTGHPQTYASRVRLTYIAADNFLSFRNFRLDIDSRNVIVGPNGSGKSNVFRCVDLVVKALAVAAEPGTSAFTALDDYATAANRRSGSSVFTVSLGIEMTEPWERALLLVFARAAVLTNLATGRSEPVVPAVIDAAVQREVTAARISSLVRGELVAHYEPGQWPWSVGYAFEHGGQRYVYGIFGTANSGIVRDRLPLPNQQALSGPRVVDRLLPGDDKTGIKPGSGDFSRFNLRMLLPATPSEYINFAVQPIPQPGGTPILNEFDRHFPSPHNNRIFAIGSALNEIFSRSLAILGDRRGLPKLHYSSADFERPPQLADGSEVPAELFRLRGGSPAERREFGRMRSLFHRLTGERIEIRNAPIVAAQPNPASGMPASSLDATLRIEPMVVEGGIDIPVQFAGAGIWEALVLSTMSVDRRGKILLLDEPASHLHPTLQTRFWRELADARMQSLLITHSAHLVPHTAEADLERVVRIVLKHGQSEARRLPPVSTDGANAPRSRWLQILRSSDFRAALFARAVVLVEGPSDMAAISAWWPKSRTAARVGSPADLNLVMLEAEGEAGFDALTRYLDSFQIPWAIVCDGKAISPTGQNALLRQLTTVDTSRVPATDAKFERWRKWWETRGAYTLAIAVDDEIERFFERSNENAWEAAKRSERGRSKPRKARAFAVATGCPSEVDRIYREILGRLGLG